MLFAVSGGRGLRDRTGVAGGNFPNVGRRRDTDRLEQFASNADGGRAQYQALAVLLEFGGAAPRSRRRRALPI